MNLDAPFCAECGKEVMASEDDAHAAIRNYARKHKPNPGRKPPTATYACPSGNGWHLTSSERYSTRRYRRNRPRGVT